MSIEFIIIPETEVVGYVSTCSGGPIYGQYWQSNSPSYGNPFGLSDTGPGFAAQAAQQNLAFLAQQSAMSAGGCTSPIEDAGISAGEIIAHRAWRCRWGGFLKSVAVDRIWPTDGVMKGNPGPEGRYGYGVYAFKDKANALERYGAIIDGPVAIGTVLLWGTVIEHEHGYRAEYGKVNSIDLICNVGWWRERRLLRRLRRRYGV